MSLFDKSFKLKPRLSYEYSVMDALCSLSAFVKPEPEDNVLCERLGVDKVYYYNHARVAMRLALSAMDLPLNSGVAVAGYNCLTVLNSVAGAGYKPVFVDVTDDFQFDMDDFDRKRQRFQVVVVSHFFGIPNKSVLAIRERYPDLLIVEDCAHALGTKLQGKQVGSQGDFSVYSYGMSKFPSIRDGGFMIVNNERFVKRVEEETSVLKAPSVLKELKNVFMGLTISFLGKPFVYKNLTMPFLKNSDNKKDFSGKYAQQELLYYRTNRYLFFRKLKSFDAQCEERRKNGEKLLAMLEKSGLPLKIIHDKDGNFFMLPTLSENRDSIINEYKEKGIELGKHFSQSIIWARKFGYLEGECPNAEKISDQIVVFPTFYEIIL